MRTTRIAFLSVASNTFVVALKVVVGIITGSVAVLSEAIHSSLDLMASLIAFFSVRISKRPADAVHPYGHGKVENVSGTIETVLIFVAGIWIIYECIHKIIHPEPIHLPILGVIVMVVGATINFVVSKIVRKEADRVHSVAMKSNALHLLTDVYTSLGVAVSLLLVTITGWYILDSIIAMVLAIYIMFEAFKLMKETFPPLIDSRLTDSEETAVLKIIESFKDEYLEVHQFRTRRSGPQEHIDFHLVVPSEKSMGDVHDLCDRMEETIEKEFPHAEVFIHPEPEHEREDKS
ncbi:cation diffusion facilitator family transporter [Alkalicoccobacillus porphyridii]|uniref:Cation transporter n=1 Tax=Alkalicoccobacillus porphyridii TaxID=2597270 RepID=A0A553ZX21_9BACI|nr:cation diffusion facilitator family transporter [Alkalicoccobacillus porphyridii]TSB45992.1 cation transporter [Alkalicoccobacillus porphyridii]